MKDMKQDPNKNSGLFKTSYLNNESPMSSGVSKGAK